MPAFYEKVRELAAQGTPRPEIAARLGLPYHAVANALYRTGLGLLLRKSWAHLYGQWRNEYASGMSVREIAEAYQANTMSVRIACRGILRRHRVRLDRPRFFMDIDTPEKAYWLGMLWADGCVNDKVSGKGQSILQLALLESSPGDGNEKELIGKFLDALGSTAAVVTTAKDPGIIYRVGVRSDLLCKDLIRLGVTPRKSFDKEGWSPKRIPEALTCDFARGLLDGDGCIYLRPGGGPQALWDGQKIMLEWLLARLKRLRLVQKAPAVRWGNRTYRLHLGAEDSCRVIEAMYKNANGLYLRRKREKAQP